MRLHLLLTIGLLLYPFAARFENLACEQVRGKQAGLARAEDQPEQAVNISSVAKLKIASRKRAYRIGEVLTLDVALLNASMMPIYVPRLASGRSFFRNQTGREKSATDYLNLDTMPTAQSYLLVGVNAVTFTPVYLSVGCNPQAFAHARAQLRSVTEGKELFDENLFISWGEACLDIRSPGNYTFSFELSNLLVVVSPEASNPPTGTGRLRSNDLAVTIIK